MNEGDAHVAIREDKIELTVGIAFDEFLEGMSESLKEAPFWR